MKDFFKHLIGKRIIKTAISTLVTAAICLWFDWPALFAVITAVVTIESTASDSIRKGIIRFPASAIGAGFAMLFYGLLGETALTYALAATLTIFVCHQLYLEAGMTVATLTALAMIAVTHGDPVSSFLIRLATVLIGITVSSLVNFFILRPNFYPQIAENIPKLYTKAATLLTTLPNRIKKGGKPAIAGYRNLNQGLIDTFRLAHYQREEWKYHHPEKETVQALHDRQKELDNLQKALYHIGNLQYTRVNRREFTEEETERISRTVTIISNSFKDPHNLLSDEQEKTLQQMYIWFKELNENYHPHVHQHVPNKMSVVYELLSLIDIADKWTDREIVQNRN